MFDSRRLLHADGRANPLEVTRRRTEGSRLVPIARALSKQLDRMTFAPPVAYVYNPLQYAWSAHEAYLERYGRGEREVLLLGMNPGPFGMAQCGVPFGDVSMVREFLGIEAEVGRPKYEHPKRPIQGFDCARSEVSGTRFWGFARERFDTPVRFFERFFVANYCPIAFLEASGRNLTPDKLRASERLPLLELCDEALRATVEVLRPRIVVGVGAFARDAAKRALAGKAIEVGCVLHPSPASPRANRGWAEQAAADLIAAGVSLD